MLSGEKFHFLFWTLPRLWGLRSRRPRPGDSSRVTGYTEIDKNVDAWDMGPLGERRVASRLGAGRLLFPIGWRENFGYKSLQRCGSGVP